MKQKFAIFDRDGTLIKHVNYLKNPDEVELSPNVEKVLNLLTNNGFKLGIYSNQSGVGRKLMTIQEVENVNSRMLELLKNIRFEFLFYCSHSPEQNCYCRKPKSEWAETLFSDHNVDTNKSYFFGDSVSDMQFALNTGLFGIHLSTHNCSNSKVRDFADFKEVLNWMEREPTFA